MSFVWEWDREKPEQETLLLGFQDSAVLKLAPTAQGFKVIATTASACHAVIRVFGGPVTAVMLDALQLLLLDSQPLSSQASIQLTHYQPHSTLAPALEIRCMQPLTADQIAQIRAVVASWQLEVLCLTQPVLLSKPGLLVMDMDSTAIQIECIDEIAALAGVGPQVAAITARAMNGELDFAASLTERVRALKHANVEILAKVLADLPLMPGLEPLVQTLLAKDWQVVIASGGFTYFTEALKTRLQLSATFANELAIENGVLTGEVVGSIVDAKRKASVVREHAAKHQIDNGQTVAIGDGANDLPMLAEAALGVAFHAKPVVQAKAKVAISRGSLLQLLYALDEQDWRL